MYMEGIKIFDKNEKEQETLSKDIRIYSQDIGIEFGIEKCAMLIAKKRKRKQKNRTTKSNCLKKKKITRTWK